MAFKQVNTQTIDIKKHQDEPFVGVLLKGEKTSGQFGENYTWHFEDEDGIPFSIYGFTMLNRSLIPIKTGSMLRVTYKGTEEVQTKKFGKKAVHQVSVEIDDEYEAKLQAPLIDQVFNDGTPVPQD